MRAEGNAEHGFTLIELMVVVAIVAVLAMIVIPNFMQSSTKSKARTETAAMFAEIATKQAQFYAEESKYMGNIGGTNYTGTTSCPTTVPTADYNFSTGCVTTGSAWEKLRIVPTESSLRCQYTITSNTKGTSFTPPTGFKNSQGTLNGAEPTLTNSWWYVHAKCDNAGGSGYSEYFQSSIDRKIQSRNEGN